MKTYRIYLITFCLVTFLSSSKVRTPEWGYKQLETKQLSRNELSNISVLSECFGYVRFFYPNSNTCNYKDFDWIDFLMHAVNRIENINNDDGLKETLLELFKPICPPISFTTDSLVSTKKLTPPYFTVEHKAIGSLANMVYGKKYSPIVKVTENDNYDEIYSYRLKENLYVNFPLAVKELPAKTKEFVRLKKEINKIFENDISLLTYFLNKKKIENSHYKWQKVSYRIADVIIRRNIIRHFYPYFSEDGLAENWDLTCMKTIEEVAQTSYVKDYYTNICKLHASVNDSHTYIYASFMVGKSLASYMRFYYPDISLSATNDTCYVNFVGKDYEAEIKKGDVVRAINHIPIETAIKQKLLEIPYSTEASGFDKIFSRGKLLESIKKDSVFEITVKSVDNIEKNIQIKTNLEYAPFYGESNFIQLLDNNLVYVNLCSDSCTYADFCKKISVIQDSKGVIFDLRGYPSFDVGSIISHFISEKIEMGNLLEPVIRYPNLINIKYEPAEKWTVFPATSPQSKEESRKNEYIEPLPIKIEKPVVFLIDGKTMSFGESFADMMKFHKVGTLVGTHTAGCNGDMTENYVDCFGFTMTYNKFLNRDGSQHHGIGILPDINCEMQISDIQNNIDTQLEKSKQLLQ